MLSLHSTLPATARASHRQLLHQVVHQVAFGQAHFPVARRERCPQAGNRQMLPPGDVTHKRCVLSGYAMLASAPAFEKLPPRKNAGGVGRATALLHQPPQVQTQLGLVGDGGVPERRAAAEGLSIVTTSQQ